MKLYQSYINEHQKSYLSKNTIPYDASGNTQGNQREYELFKKIQKELQKLETEAWGLVSWKFEHKCQIPITDFISFAEDRLQNGYECAFINPMIGNEALYINVWEQGVHSGHYGMDKIAQFLQKNMGPFFDCYMDKSVFSLCNYFVAKPVFWKNYFAFVDQSISSLEAEASAGTEIGSIYSGSSHYARDEALSMKPFILERLLSSFLCSTDLKKVSYDYKIDQYHDKFGKRLGDFLYKHSEKKNSGIKNRDQKTLEEYNEIRRSCYDQDFVKITTGLDDCLNMFTSEAYKSNGY